MFGKHKREEKRVQRMYEQSLREVDGFVSKAKCDDAIETRLRQAAQKKIAMVRRGMKADGVTPDTNSILHLAQVGADSYLDNSRCTKYEAERVHEIFQEEYDQALGTGSFLNPFTGEMEDY